MKFIKANDITFFVKFGMAMEGFCSASDSFAQVAIEGMCSGSTFEGIVTQIIVFVQVKY